MSAGGIVTGSLRDTSRADEAATLAASIPRYGLGAIAQLGERLHGMQEVSGSIPLGSTNRKFNRISHLNAILALVPGERYFS
jgi:hypothetical protein